VLVVHELISAYTCIVTILFYQWAFGVTCWEIFTCGRVPYHGISAMGLLYALKDGERLEKPNNAACSDEM